VRILGEDIPVRAKIHTINGFSAHADQAELLTWHGHTVAGRTFLTHGEEPTMQQFATRLVKTRVEMPQLHQVFEL
jgi:metallo-beta-lactamase family protein